MTQSVSVLSGIGLYAFSLLAKRRNAFEVKLQRWTAAKDLARPIVDREDASDADQVLPVSGAGDANTDNVNVCESVTRNLFVDHSWNLAFIQWDSICQKLMKVGQCVVM